MASVGDAYGDSRTDQGNFVDNGPLHRNLSADPVRRQDGWLLTGDMPKEPDEEPVLNTVMPTKL